EFGRGDEPAREIIGPGMPGAGEARASFGRLCHHTDRPVAADIEEAADLSILVAQQENWPAGELHWERVAGIGDVGGEGGGAPDAREEAMLLHLEELSREDAPR